MRGPLDAAARRPVAIFMIVVAVFVFGIVSYSRLDLALLPDLSYPTLTVRTEFPGAGPRDVDKRITEVLEKRLATTNGLVALTSVSRSDLSDITLEFRWDTDMTAVRAEIDAKLDGAVLPDDAKKPLLLPYDPNLEPILRIAVSAKGNREADLALARKLAEEEVEKELKKLPGVAAAKIRGGREREIDIYLDEAALRRSGIRVSEVANIVSTSNRNEAAGKIAEGPIEYIVRSVNELRDNEEIENLVVRRINGVPIRVGDLGRVTETFKEREMAAFLNGKEAVLVEVYKRADSNLVAVAERVRDRLFGSGAEARKPETRVTRRGRRRGRGGGAPSTTSISESIRQWADIKVLTDQSRFIQGAIDEVRDTAILGGIFAVLVIYLFLRNGASTLIAGLVIAICVVATFAPMFLAKVSLNVMSLGGLALGIGMLVDNAIVVLESAARRRAAGLDAAEAAIVGVKDVAGAITASTLTSVCVFFPIVFVEQAGVAGQVFRDLALTVVFALLVSLAVALFVIPTFLAVLPRLSGRNRHKRVRHRWFGAMGRVLGARWALSFSKLRRRRTFARLWFGFWLVLYAPFAVFGRGLAGLFAGLVWAVGGGVFLAAMATRALLWPIAMLWSRGYEALERAYLPFLRACMAQRGFVVFVSVGSLAFAGWRATTLSPDLIPESMTGEFDVRVAFAPGTPLERTASRLLPIEKALRDLADVEWVASTVGVEADADRKSDEGEHTSQLTLHLIEEAHTREREEAVRRQVREMLRNVPDVLPPEFLPSTLFRFAIPLRIVFYGAGEEDLSNLSRASQELANELRTFSDVESVQVGLGRGAREVRLTFDREELFRRDLTVEEVAQRIRHKLQGVVPTALVEGSKRTDIRVRLQESDRATLRQLRMLDISNPQQDPIPLESILAEPPRVAEGPGEIRRVGGRHAAVVTAAYKGLQLGRLADAARDAAEPIADRHRVEVRVEGRSEEAKRSLGALLFALLLAVFLVYAVMAAQFESLLQPILIMVSLPLAGVGAIVALDLLSLPLSVVVLLGAILLTGIAVNNAIVLLDCINRRRVEGRSVKDAILVAAQERLRPILMTTATTILGLLPLTGVLAHLPGAELFPFGLGGGEAAELRAPMAITVIGGLFTSTLLTLVLVPVLYEMAAGPRPRSTPA